MVHCTRSHLWTLVHKEVAHCLEQTSAVATLKVPTIFKYWIFEYGAICSYICFTRFWMCINAVADPGGGAAGTHPP